MTTPSSGAAGGQALSTASAIEPAALPAPTTTVRPRGGGGRWVGTISSGFAAATAALKLPSSSSRGVMKMIGFPPSRGRRASGPSTGRRLLARRGLQDRFEVAPGEARGNPDHLLGRALRHHLA